MDAILRRRRRLAAPAALLVALAGSTAALTTTGPAGSAPPAGDCAAPYPVSSLAVGQPVTGLTVERGTVPDTFTGEVLGVLEDGILPGLDMVLAELDSPAIERAGGIWAGMSGSPVYDDATGDLIGAVAYGLSWGSSPIAGITPFEAMDDHLSPVAAPRTVAMDAATARRVARRTEVTRTQAAAGLRRLPVPFGVSGLDDQRLEAAAAAAPRRLRFLDLATHVLGVDADAATAADLVAGGNLGAAVSFGDIDAGGIGTVTSVCGDELVGFGHPAYATGRTSLSLHPADALVVQPDSLGTGFKVANLAEPVGTFTGDHLTGITGRVGPLPRTTDLSTGIAYRDRRHDGATRVALPQAAPDIAATLLIASHDRAINAWIPGSETQGWRITGTWRGTPWTIAHDDVVRSTWDIALEAPWDLVNVLYALSRMRGVVVDAVDFDADVSDSTRAWRIRGLEWRAPAGWRTLDEEHPARVSAGSRLRVRALLAGAGTTRTVAAVFRVPRRLAGERGSVTMVGGGSTWTSLWRARDVDALRAKVAGMTRNDQVEARLRIGGRRDGLRVTKVSDPLGTVVLRGAAGPLRVRR